MSQPYIPHPVDTAHTPLGGDLAALTEQLAENAHEVWAAQRVKDGWTHGPVRNDAAKQHPCLIPYKELPESEKEYDRNAAVETLKLIQTLGYSITPPGNAGAVDAALIADSQYREKSERLLDQLQRVEGQPAELAVLLQAWNARLSDDPAWRRTPEVYRRLGRRFLKLGAAPQAKEVARAALDWSTVAADGREVQPWAGDVELRQILGLALARTSNPDDAQAVLMPLYESGQTSDETLGILARTYKDQAAQFPEGSPRRIELLEKSLQIYAQAYAHSESFWTGINVATMNALLGRMPKAQEVADRVRVQCQSDLDHQRQSETPAIDTYWHLATLGEAALIAGDVERAGQWYLQAHGVAPRNFGDLNSTRRHARWLLECVPQLRQPASSVEGLLNSWLPLPLVVVFAGHMVDHPERSASRFPPRLVEPVRRALLARLASEPGVIGYSSAACGADLLFQEAVQELGGESRLVLPYDREEFRRDSVDFAGAEWGALFDRVLDGATQIVTASPQMMAAGGVSYDYANLVLHGLAAVRQAELQTDLTGLAVWDGKSGDGPGGTASVVRRWRDLGLRVDCIALPDIPAGHDVEPLPELELIHNPEPPPAAVFEQEPESGGTRVMSMLFGDAVNFSRLSEAQVPRFIQHFLGPIAEIVQRYGSANVVKNTWGDGLYLVFNTVREAGLCALDICDFVRSQVQRREWARLGLPEELSVRLALHAGPVFGCVDPITGQANYTGTHVSRAARLEPKTPPGEVYASEAFAALSAQERIDAYACEYVKQLAWAKHYGTFPTFVLRRKKSAGG